MVNISALWRLIPLPRCLSNLLIAYITFFQPFYCFLQTREKNIECAKSTYVLIQIVQIKVIFTHLKSFPGRGNDTHLQVAENFKFYNATF